MLSKSCSGSSPSSALIVTFKCAFWPLLSPSSALIVTFQCAYCHLQVRFFVTFECAFFSEGCIYMRFWFSKIYPLINLINTNKVFIKFINKASSFLQSRKRSRVLYLKITASAHHAQTVNEALGPHCRQCGALFYLWGLA